MHAATENKERQSAPTSQAIRFIPQLNILTQEDRRQKEDKKALELDQVSH